MLLRRSVARITRPPKGLDPLQQVGNLLVGVLVMGVEDVGPLAKSASVSPKKRIHSLPSALSKRRGEVLLRLADVLRHHPGGSTRKTDRLPDREDFVDSVMAGGRRPRSCTPRTAEERDARLGADAFQAIFTPTPCQGR